MLFWGIRLFGVVGSADRHHDWRGASHDRSPGRTLIAGALEWKNLNGLEWKKLNGLCEAYGPTQWGCAVEGVGQMYGLVEMLSHRLARKPLLPMEGEVGTLFHNASLISEASRLLRLLRRCLRTPRVAYALISSNALSRLEASVNGFYKSAVPDYVICVADFRCTMYFRVQR